MNRMFKMGMALRTVAQLTVGCSSTDDATPETAAAAKGTTADLDSSIANRAEKVELSKHGGARRLDSDQTEFVRNAASQTGAENVILLIGDGMDDSEITIARNYALGASETSMHCR